jgi:hypothetical protein
MARRRNTPSRRFRAAALVIAAAAAAAALLLAGCGTDTSSSEESAGATGSPAVSPSWTGVPISAADTLAVRRLVGSFWEAYNAYDPERVISYLDEHYRPIKEPVVRDEIRRLKAFSVTLGVSEKSAPVLVEPNEAEVFLNMKTPTGTRTVRMRLVRRGDDWVVTYSEEVR